MSDATPSQRSSSVAYALGQLTERIDNTKQAVEALPSALSPRFDKLEGRVTTIEQRQWMWMGGGAVLLAISSIFFGHAIH